MEKSVKNMNLMVRPLLGMWVAVLLLAGCAGGDNGDPPPPRPKTTALEGSAFAPGSGTSSKAFFSKALPGSGPFVGASIVARSLKDGKVYPLDNSAKVGLDGIFGINQVPFGQDYLITARKGNLVVMRLISIPDDAGPIFSVGEVDAASTAAVLLMENFIKEALGIEVNLRVDW